MKCKICKNESEFIFQAKILDKYDVEYYYCEICGFLQTEEPYWLEEAYVESINISDTGIMSRNLSFSEKVSLIIYFLFNKDGKYVDFAGGYGIFTRLMRDNGFDFYWNDLYSKNLVARGFEYAYQDNNSIDMLTSFESFEHFSNPLDDIEKMLSVSENIFFSTNILPKSIPKVNEWWYYGLEHGQHISFYSIRTLEYIAKKNKLNLYTNGSTIHLLTRQKLNRRLFLLILKLNKLGVFYLIKRLMKSKTVTDMNMINNKRR